MAETSKTEEVPENRLRLTARTTLHRSSGTLPPPPPCWRRPKSNEDLIIGDDVDDVDDVYQNPPFNQYSKAKATAEASTVETKTKAGLLVSVALKQSSQLAIQLFLSTTSNKKTSLYQSSTECHDELIPAAARTTSEGPSMAEDRTRTSTVVNDFSAAWPNVHKEIV